MLNFDYSIKCKANIRNSKGLCALYDVNLYGKCDGTVLYESNSKRDEFFLDRFEDYGLAGGQHWPEGVSVFTTVEGLPNELIVR